MRSFASDNNSSVHPAVMGAIVEANRDHALGYGDDEWTERAENSFRKMFGDAARVFMVFNGTGANCVALQAAVPSWGSVLCADVAHIYNDECGAPGKMTGAAIQTIPTEDGKLTPQMLEPCLCAAGVVHHSQPRAIYVSQTTELGTVYTVEEMRALADFAHASGMLLHVDGARLANAAAALECSLAEAVGGADIVSFGGTKNGMMMGEAVVVLNPALAENMEWIRKQSAQLASKMRYLAAGFVPYLDDVWLANARNANDMAARLAGILNARRVEIVQKVESNQVFCRLGDESRRRLETKYFFYTHHGVSRFVTSWDTVESDIWEFASLI